MIALQLEHLTLSRSDDALTGLADVPAMQRRRLSKLSKLAINSAVLARQAQSIDAIVWASNYGDEEKTSQILSDVARGDTPSPTQFSMSVNNAIAGLYSILFNDATPSTCLSDGWQQALIEACAQLRSSAAIERVLVVAYDEPLPAMYLPEHDFEAFALAAVVSLPAAAGNLQLNTLSASASIAGDALQFYQHWQAASGALQWPSA